MPDFGTSCEETVAQLVYPSPCTLVLITGESFMPLLRRIELRKLQTP